MEGRNTLIWRRLHSTQPFLLFLWALRCIAKMNFGKSLRGGRIDCRLIEYRIAVLRIESESGGIGGRLLSIDTFPGASHDARGLVHAQ
jgi:hypothetical protein